MIKITNKPEDQRTLPRWILFISGIFALLELIATLSLCFFPETVIENVNLNVSGVQYLIYMWAARQFALAVIFAYATYKRSPAMLTIAYIFFFVMFIGDMLIGILQKEYLLIITAGVMCIISAGLIYVMNKKGLLLKTNR